MLMFSIFHIVCYQLTRPTDAPVPLKSLDELVRCLDAEYDNPQFTVSLLAKFSRKLYEPNVFTKLKSMVGMFAECLYVCSEVLTRLQYLNTPLPHTYTLPAHAYTHTYLSNTHILI